MFGSRLATDNSNGGPQRSLHGHTSLLNKTVKMVFIFVLLEKVKDWWVFGFGQVMLMKYDMTFYCIVGRR